MPTRETAPLTAVLGMLFLAGVPNARFFFWGLAALMAHKAQTVVTYEKRAELASLAREATLARIRARCCWPAAAGDHPLERPARYRAMDFAFLANIVRVISAVERVEFVQVECEKENAVHEPVRLGQAADLSFAASSISPATACARS